MPQFDLRGIQIAKYVNTNGVISYTDRQSAGDAMTANMELRYAEGRLYAESTLAAYMRKATGGSISLGVKYIPNAAQKIMFGSREKQRTVGQPQITGLVLGGQTTIAYVGVGLYAPDMIDGVEKFTAVKIAKALFGPPSTTLQTAGENIVFNTPTTTGEFLADDSTDQDMIEVAICDTEEDAIAWVTAALT